MTESLVLYKEIDIYDNSYPVEKLRYEIGSRLLQAEKFADDVYKAVVGSAPVARQLKGSMDKDFRFVVEMPEDVKAAIAKGDVKLSVENCNRMYAQLRKANGEYGDKLSIVREDFMVGIDPVQMATALQMVAIQNQLEEMSRQIRMIDYSVKEVMQGQQNDRIAQYYSGLALYSEASEVYNPDMKNALLAQSLKSLSEASFTLTMQIKSDIKYLADKEYKKDRKHQTALMDEKISRIHQSFEVIHQSALLRAGIYCEQNEISAMISVLKEYSSFINNTIAKNAYMLAQCDLADDNTENSVWNSRAKLKLDVDKLNSVLKSQEKVIYLSAVGEA